MNLTKYEQETIINYNNEEKDCFYLYIRQVVNPQTGQKIG